MCSSDAELMSNPWERASVLFSPLLHTLISRLNPEQDRAKMLPKRNSNYIFFYATGFFSYSLCHILFPLEKFSFFLILHVMKYVIFTLLLQ